MLTYWYAVFLCGTPGGVNNPNCELGVEDTIVLEIAIFPNPMEVETTIVVRNVPGGIEIIMGDL
tara:strand:+ start:20747 stop:20938 length:192 start_codon:yes stop_codon:yes gene_type:complete